jgi:hypothetical protein
MDSFATTIGNLLLAQARIAAINRNSLNEEQRKARAHVLSELQEAVSDLVELRFSELSARAKQNAEKLDESAAELSEKLEGMKRKLAMLDAASAAIGVIAGLVKLLA